VIDDDAELCKLVTRFLTHEGFAVRWVSGGTAGIEQALGEDYALILLDVKPDSRRGKSYRPAGGRALV